jgi:hypothetical protein
MDKVTNPDIAVKLKNLLDNPQVDSHTKDGFLTSLSLQFKAKGFLSNNQNVALERIVANYSFDNLEWKQKFLNSEMKENFKVVVDFYRRTSYYANIVSKVNKDAGYIPTPSEYTAICDNKYAKLVIEGFRGIAKYKLGEMIRLREKNGITSGSGIGTIIEVTNSVYSACRGNKVYRVYFAETGRTLELEERKIALARQKDYDSIAEQNANETPF